MKRPRESGQPLLDQRAEEMLAAETVPPMRNRGFGRFAISCCLGILLVHLMGCVSGPFLENPTLVSVDGASTVVDAQNPVYIPPHEYNAVFENVLKVLNESGFEIYESNRWDGRIETLPRTAPGIGQPFKAGSPTFGERLLATAQSMRHRASVRIHPANNGGFFVQVIVLKELEDLPAPVRSTAGGALFRTDNNVDRHFEVLDPSVLESNWIPRGRDIYLEQVILQRLRDCM